MKVSKRKDEDQVDQQDNIMSPPHWAGTLHVLQSMINGGMSFTVYIDSRGHYRLNWTRWSIG